MKPDVLKLSDEELFDYDASEVGDYSQTLFQAHLEISDNLISRGYKEDY